VSSGSPEGLRYENDVAQAFRPACAAAHARVVTNVVRAALKGCATRTT